MNKTPNLTQADIERIKQDFGTDDLFIDAQGDIVDKFSGVVVAQHKSVDEVQSEDKKACKEYFDGLPTAVKNELLKAALAFSVERAVSHMNRFTTQCDKNELWSLSYEELAKITAEGILLGDE